MRPIHGLSAFVVSITMLSVASAQEYAAGQTVEYFAYDKWDVGVVLRKTTDGKQFIVRMKEAPGGTKGGEERAFYPKDLRPVIGAKPKQDPMVPMVKPMPDPGPGRIPPVKIDPPGKVDPPAKIDPKKPIVIVPAKGKGLMTKEDVLGYLNTNLAGKPDLTTQWKVLENLREELKARGANFTVDNEFWTELWKRGAIIDWVTSGIDSNYGKVPTVEDYFGTYLLRGAKRGVKTLSKDGTKLIQTNSDAQMETGAITINRDGSFIWKLDRNDPEAKWVKGKWRVAKDNERVVTEGGAVLVLENTRGETYHVRKSRIPHYEGWIDLGVASNRSSIHYGRPVQ